MGGDVLLVLSVFLACVVEAVEALTIVLAVGISRGWRATLQGVAAGLLGLAVVVATLGPLVSSIPLSALRLVVGGLLLIFGLGWLRKAILRASGYQAHHDETAIYARQTAAAQRAAGTRRAGIQDWYAFTLAFKGVLLEGLEVAFIVVTFGANQHRIGLAVLGAVAAIVVVAAAGIAVRSPLSRVPENTMKLVVGVLLTSFGTFWGAEGAGALWPAGDASLPVVIAYTAVVAGLLILVLRRRRRASLARTAPAACGGVD